MNFRRAKWLGLAIVLTGLCLSKAAAQVADPILWVAGVNNSTQPVAVSISDTTSGATRALTFTTLSQLSLQKNSGS